MGCLRYMALVEGLGKVCMWPPAVRSSPDGGPCGRPLPVKDLRPSLLIYSFTIYFQGFFSSTFVKEGEKRDLK